MMQTPDLTHGESKSNPRVTVAVSEREEDTAAAAAAAVIVSSDTVVVGEVSASRKWPPPSPMV